MSREKRKEEENGIKRSLVGEHDELRKRPPTKIHSPSLLQHLEHSPINSIRGGRGDSVFENSPYCKSFLKRHKKDQNRGAIKECNSGSQPASSDTIHIESGEESDHFSLPTKTATPSLDIDAILYPGESSDFQTTHRSAHSTEKTLLPNESMREGGGGVGQMECRDFSVSSVLVGELLFDKSVWPNATIGLRLHHLALLVVDSSDSNLKFEIPYSQITNGHIFRSSAKNYIDIKTSLSCQCIPLLLLNSTHSARDGKEDGKGPVRVLRIYLDACEGLDKFFSSLAFCCKRMLKIENKTAYRATRLQITSLDPDDFSVPPRRSFRNSDRYSPVNAYTRSRAADAAKRPSTSPRCAIPRKKADPEFLFKYPEEGKTFVPITSNDLLHIPDGVYLNDNLIDFDLLYTLHKKPVEVQDRVHVMNSFFYPRLRDDEAFIHKFDIFSKDFVLVPVCQSLHWTLIILSNLKSLLEPPKRAEDAATTNGAGSDAAIGAEEAAAHASIFVLDSLGSRHRSRIVRLFKEYIVKDAFIKHNAIVEPTKVLCRYANVPLQRNLTDCGLFVLESADRFLNDPWGVATTIMGKERMDAWYAPEEANLRRKAIMNNIRNLRSTYVHLITEVSSNDDEGSGEENVVAVCVVK